jgi:hypothetical protein
MWTYAQSTGDLTHDGVFEGSGYSGRSACRNISSAESIPNYGPIPRGVYAIGRASEDHPKLGPCVMELTPSPSTNTFSRSDFFIHGDNANRDASHGCIILGPAIRHLIANSGDTDLTVIA